MRRFFPILWLATACAPLPEPDIVIGTGEIAFEPVADGEEIEVIRGPRAASISSAPCGPPGCIPATENAWMRPTTRPPRFASGWRRPAGSRVGLHARARR